MYSVHVFSEVQACFQSSWKQIAGVLNLAVVKNGAKMLKMFICQSMHTLKSKLKTDTDERHVQLHYASVLKKGFKHDGPHRQVFFRLSIIQPVIITE